MDVVLVAQPNTLRSLTDALAADPDITVSASCKGVAKGVATLRDTTDVDLVFAQHELGDGTAFDLLDEADPSCPVVLLAKDADHMERAFRYNIIDYIILPAEPVRIMASVMKFRKYFKEASEVGYLKDLQSLMTFIAKKDQDYKSRFMVRVGNVIKSIAVDEIAYFYTQDRVTRLVTVEGKRYPVDQRLDELEEVLDPKRFTRANRQYIVSIDSIAEIHPYFKGRVKINLRPTQDGDIVISSEKTPSFKEWLDV